MERRRGEGGIGYGLPSVSLRSTAPLREGSLFSPAGGTGGILLRLAPRIPPHPCPSPPGRGRRPRGGGRGEGGGVAHGYGLDPSVSLRSTAPLTKGELNLKGAAGGPRIFIFACGRDGGILLRLRRLSHLIPALPRRGGEGGHAGEVGRGRKGLPGPGMGGAAVVDTLDPSVSLRSTAPLTKGSLI